MSVVITAADVKKLRDQTGAGMSDCKTALQEAQGDFDAAIEYLRKKGQKMTEKRADRDAKEGVVLALVSEDQTKGIVLRISCETDFVAKNAEFIAFAQSIAELALATFPQSKDELLSQILPSGVSVADSLSEKTGVIGEKIELPNYEFLQAAQVVPYIHMGNKAAVIVGFDQAGNQIVEAGKNVAMQIAAMHPIAVDKDGVDASVVEKEIEIGKEQARNEGKPENLLEKIAMGKLQAFYKEKTLLNQEYVKDSSKTVKAYLDSVSKGLTTTGFKHVTLG